MILRLVKINIKQSLRDFIALLIIISIMIFISCLSLFLTNEVSQYVQVISFGDYFYNLLYGMRVYKYNPYNPFIFPALWLVVIFSLLYIPLHCFSISRTALPILILIYSHSRYTYATAHVITAFVHLIISYAVIILTIMVFTLTTGGELDVFTTELANYAFVYNIPYHDRACISLLPYIVAVPILLMPYILIELGLTELKNIHLGFLSNVVILFSTTYFCEPYLIGNYLMLNRFESFKDQNLSLEIGLLISIVLIVVIFLLTLFFFEHKDIYTDIKENHGSS